LSTHKPGAALLLASALTKLHPGAGRSPGTVDLPVIRDPLGYPYIPGSQVKGSLKTRLAARQGAIKENEKKGATVDCDQAPCICYLLGAEPGEGQHGASAIQIGDLYPLLIPAPAANPEGVVFITTPYLLAKAAATLRAAGIEKDADALEKVATCKGEKVQVSVKGVLVDGHLYSIDQLLPSLANEVRGLNPLYQLLNTNILVVPDGHGRVLIDQLLPRVTRVRLDKKTKTVAGGGLWTEEYLPWGTLFLGAIFETGFHNIYKDKCNPGGARPLEELEDQLKGLDAIVVGGKESVGAGLLRIKLAKP